jgi:streptomycin 6-kinase
MLPAQPPAISERLRRAITAIFEDQGVAWLAGLPALLAECERRWGLTIAPAFPNLSYNYVAPAVRADGLEIVIKLGVPNPELSSEAAALRVYDGRGSIRLVDADADAGILLLERVRPGTTLADLTDDDAATAIAADVMRQLWRPAPPDHPFPTVERWSKSLFELRGRFGGGTGPLPEHLVALAASLATELIGSMAAPVVLHADLHHGNILAAERQPWLAIDPKGVAGEPAYEVGALLRNPMPQILAMPQPRRVLARRVDLLAERLGFDRQRLIGWGVSQAVLSACWSLEDGGDEWVGLMAELASMLAELLE